jgi:hypothetical protein
MYWNDEQEKKRDQDNRESNNITRDQINKENPMI